MPSSRGPRSASLVEHPVGQQRTLPGRLRLLRQRALLGLNPASEHGEQRIVRVEHQRLLALIRPGLRIDPRRPRDHLLEPGARADVGQGRHHGHLGRVEPLVGHRHRHQDRGLGQQPEGGERFMGVALGRGGEADVAPGLLGRHPASQHVEVGPRRGLIGRDDQQLAEPARCGAGWEPALGPSLGAQLRASPRRPCAAVPWRSRCARP